MNMKTIMNSRSNNYNNKKKKMMIIKMIKIINSFSKIIQIILTKKMSKRNRSTHKNLINKNKSHFNNNSSYSLISIVKRKIINMNKINLTWNIKKNRSDLTNKPFFITLIMKMKYWIVHRKIIMLKSLEMLILI